MHTQGRLTRLLRQACRAVGTMLAVAGIALLLVEAQERHALRRIGEAYGPNRTARESTDGTADTTVGDADGGIVDETTLPQPDWQQLADISPDICGWICVDRTDIDLPVMSSALVPAGFYLTHDLQGRPSRSGVPYLDDRCEPQGRHCLVYGHHLATGGQFSALQKAYRQEVFDAVGCCRWHTPETATVTYEPLCALLVDQWFEPIQQFGFADDGELCTWLASMLAQAKARSPEAEKLAAQATRVMTLATCASDLSGQPWRTLVVFVAPT